MGETIWLVGLEIIIIIFPSQISIGEEVTRGPNMVYHIPS